MQSIRLRSSTFYGVEQDKRGKAAGFVDPVAGTWGVLAETVADGWEWVVMLKRREEDVDEVFCFEKNGEGFRAAVSGAREAG